MKEDWHESATVKLFRSRNNRRRNRPPERRKHRLLNLMSGLACGLTIMALMFLFTNLTEPWLSANAYGNTVREPESWFSANAYGDTEGETAIAPGLATDTKSVVDAPSLSAPGISPDNRDSMAQNTVAATECLILVNKWNNIPADYEVSLVKLSNGQRVSEQIYPALQAMFEAAREDGVYPVVASGYRTAEEQQRLMDEKIAVYKAEGYSDAEAKAKAETWVAIPGTSEHQLGLAVDINANNFRTADKEIYAWLAQNSYRFGFIRRYAADKTEITGIVDEPWHYRYVGIDAATEMYRQSLCLEEYLANISQ